MPTSIAAEVSVDFTAPARYAPPPAESPLSPSQRAEREEALRQKQLLVYGQSQMRGVPESALHD